MFTFHGGFVLAAKLFLFESDQSSIRDAVEMGKQEQHRSMNGCWKWQPLLTDCILSSPACQTLAVSQLDSVIIAARMLLGDDDQTLAPLQPAWEELEALVHSQRIAAIGTSDLDKDLLEQLYNWAQVCRKWPWQKCLKKKIKNPQDVHFMCESSWLLVHVTSVPCCLSRSSPAATKWTWPPAAWCPPS